MARGYAIDNKWPVGARACCLISRQPVYTSPDWCWQSPQRRYAVKITRIGARILSLETRGHITLDRIRHGWAAFQQALADAPPEGGDFVIIDNHAHIDGATLNARSYLARQLQQVSNWKAYIAYGAPHVFKLGLNLARQMDLFQFQIQMAADYDEAIRAAQNWHARPRRYPSQAAKQVEGAVAAESREDALAARVAGGEDANQLYGPREMALRHYAQELFRHIGKLSLDRYGVAAVHPTQSSDHPFRSVYDALGMIHADMIQTLARNQRYRLRLQKQEQALLEKNAALVETQTTLNILLRNRQDARRKKTARIGQRFRDLLLPIIDGLADTKLTPRQHRQVEFIRDIIANIGHAFNFNPMSGAVKLTPRETLTAYLVARGCSTREAAAVMNTSPRTVERYRAGLRRKAGLEGTGRPLAPWLSRQRDDGLASGTDPR